MAFTIKGGKFSTTDDDKTIRQPRIAVEDPVIDILDDRTQALSNIQYVQPQRPAPVNVGMMPERRGNVNIPMGQSTFVNIPDRPGDEQAQAPLKVQSPFTTVTRLPGGEGIRELLQSYDPQGIAGINTQGGYLGDELFNTPTDLGASIDPYEQMGDNLLGGDASTVYGINPIVKRIAEFQGYDMDTDEGVRKYLADTQQTMKDSEDALEARRKDQDREMAAMLAAQQQQPVDPCPEGYRMDPVSRVCVPTGDTATDTEPGTGRVYETLQEPVADYTAKTDFTVPTITLPDIFTGN